MGARRRLVIAAGGASNRFACRPCRMTWQGGQEARAVVWAECGAAQAYCTQMRAPLHCEGTTCAHCVGISLAFNVIETSRLVSSRKVGNVVVVVQIPSNVLGYQPRRATKSSGAGFQCVGTEASALLQKANNKISMQIGDKNRRTHIGTSQAFDFIGAAMLLLLVGPMAGSQFVVVVVVVRLVSGEHCFMFAAELWPGGALRR